MLQRILVPLDGSERAEQAIPLAARLARATGGALFFVRVVETIHAVRIYFPLETAYLQEIDEWEHAKAHKYLAEKTAESALIDIEMHSLVVSGSAPAALLQVARQEHIDLIVLCSHGYTGFKRWALGSVAQKVVRQSQMPVLLVREDGIQEMMLSSAGTRPVGVMVALDGSPFAEEVVHPAANLSLALSAPWPGALHLVQVIPLVAEPIHVVEITHGEERSYDFLPLEETRAIATATAYLSRVQQQIEQDVGGQGKLLVTTSVLTDPDVASCLLAEAEKRGRRETGATSQDCDVLALATHGRSGPTRWVIGSITERLLGATKQPLLIVHPPTSQKKQR